MELSVNLDNLEWMEDDKWNRRDMTPYTVRVDEHRILTVATDCIETAKKWLKEAVKTRNNKFGSLLVGVHAERRSDHRKDDNGPDGPYDILELCVGSKCLIFKVRGYHSYFSRDQDFSCFDEFFSASHVIAVGVDMLSVAKNLEKHQGIRFANPTDLNQMAVWGMKREDLAKYDVDRLATTVLGKEYWIERVDTAEWFEGGYYYFDAEFTDKFVMHGTFESYFVYLIGSKLLEMMNGGCGTGLLKKSKKKKKKKWSLIWEKVKRSSAGVFFGKII